MKNIKLSLHEYKHKTFEIIENIKKKLDNFRKEIKVKIIRIVARTERRFGMRQRCSWCKENIFCEQYYERKKSGIIFNVARCYTRVSNK